MLRKLRKHARKTYHDFKTLTKFTCLLARGIKETQSRPTHKIQNTKDF